MIPSLCPQCQSKLVVSNNTSWLICSHSTHEHLFLFSTVNKSWFLQKPVNDNIHYAGYDAVKYYVMTSKGNNSITNTVIDEFSIEESVTVLNRYMKVLSFL